MDVYSIFAGLEDKVLAFHKGSWPSCPQPDGTVLEDIVNRIAKLQFVFVNVLVVIQAVQRLILASCGSCDRDSCTGQMGEFIMMVLIALLLYLMRQVRPFPSNESLGKWCTTFNTIRHIISGISHASVFSIMFLIMWRTVQNWDSRGLSCNESEFNGTLFAIRLLTPVICAYICKMSAILALCHFYALFRKTTAATEDAEMQVSTV